MSSCMTATFWSAALMRRFGCNYSHLVPSRVDDYSQRGRSRHWHRPDYPPASALYNNRHRGVFRPDLTFHAGRRDHRLEMAATSSNGNYVADESLFFVAARGMVGPMRCL